MLFGGRENFLRLGGAGMGLVSLGAMKHNKRQITEVTCPAS